MNGIDAHRQQLQDQWATRRAGYVSQLIESASAVPALDLYAIFDAGEAAFAAELAELDCPYMPAHQLPHDAWLQGWREARDRQEQKMPEDTAR